MPGRILISFLAGFASFVAPCVLPLVPGYLSAVSAVDPSRLGDPRAARRVVVASLPFILGFTVVFVILGAAAAAIGGIVNPDRQLEIAGFVLVVLGLVFMGLLPWPERIIAPGLLTGARRQGSTILLGGAFAVCAAPCIGTVLAGILVLAADSRTVVRGSLLPVMAQASESTADPRSVRFGQLARIQETSAIARFAMRLAENFVLGAFSGPYLVGVAGFYVQPRPKHRHKGMLWGMYVRPDCRTAGIGRKLVEAIIAHARQHVELLQLFVIADNRPARRLYASLGFVEYGIELHATKYQGQYHDDVLMALPLVVDSGGEAACAPTKGISAKEVPA